MVEYILVLVVVISVVLALIRIMYKPMDVFITTMMGDYLECLLQTGELPILGKDGAQTATCTPPAYEPGVEGQLSDADGDGQADQGGDNLNSDKSVGNVSRRGGVQTFNRNRQGFRQSAFSDANGNTAGADGSSAAGKTSVLPMGEGGGFYNFAGGRHRGGRTTRYIALTGELYEEVKKKQKRQNQTQSTPVPREFETGMMKQKKREVAPPPPRPPEVDTEFNRFDVSKYLKYFLIAAIIIVILVLIGGQALQLSKSWEKGE